MNIKHHSYGVVEDVQEGWLPNTTDGKFSTHGWLKDGAWYLEEYGWRDAYTPLPFNAIPDIELERIKRDRTERMQVVAIMESTRADDSEIA